MQMHEPQGRRLWALLSLDGLSSLDWLLNLKYALEINGVEIKFRPIVHQDIDGRATSGVLGWSVAFGPPLHLSLPQNRSINVAFLGNSLRRDRFVGF